MIEGKRVSDPKNLKAGIEVTKKLVNSAIVNTVTASDLSLMKEGQSKLITLTLENTAIADVMIPFGTPLGDSKEVGFYPQASANLTVGGLTLWSANLATIKDNQGVNATFLQALNARFLRHATYVSQIETITPNTALGEQQRAENITRVVLPLNSVTDACVRAGSFVPQYTEYTGTFLLGVEGIVLSDFHGFYYRLLAGSSVKLNMFIQSIDTPVFKAV